MIFQEPSPSSELHVDFVDFSGSCRLRLRLGLAAGGDLQDSKVVRFFEARNDADKLPGVGEGLE